MTDAKELQKTFIYAVILNESVAEKAQHIQKYVSIFQQHFRLKSTVDGRPYKRTQY